ncbi:hypothetical protein [Cesiribacter sp. SM1]|uniref:hypothetical protein n=1 Tax=Cesiribacter sp. SM1 TaxID=2861196 RepID=UPI001CD73985|nr:hypothetical protein [Cesiribacter sp. SM1]
MKIQLCVLPLLFTLFLFGCGNSGDKTAEQQTAIDTSQTEAPEGVGIVTDGPTQITGLLQTSGLQPDEAKALGLPERGYQLVSQNAYFLKGSDTLAAYLGQCVTLSGQMQEDWQPEQHGGQITYNRGLFVVEEVHPQLYSYCHYTDTLETQPQGREVNYTGQVERMQRPAPDIAYDYQLRLQKPYRDQNHPVSPGKLVQTLPLVPGSFSVLSTLEAAVRQNRQLRVEGIQHQGYAESQAVWVTAADSLAL